MTLDALTTMFGTPDVVFLDVGGFECRALAGALATFAARHDWFVEVHVGCGLEAASGSFEEVLSYFQEAEFERFVHSECDQHAIPLASAPPEKLRSRFFLTALRKTGT